MLTRLFIESGAYLSSLEGVPACTRWTESMIESSMASMLDTLRDDSDVWIFGYGSLIWNPLIHHAQRCSAVLKGWQRQFCQRLLGGRADTAVPGRMLGLCPGGLTQGVAYRLSAETLHAELRLVWTREMAMGAYRPIWAPLRLIDNGQIRYINAIVFVADPEHPLFEKDSDVATVAPLIADAVGPWGSNAEYVFNLAEALRGHGVNDPYIDSLENTLGRCVSASC
jgi:cation transport protein ChaC